MSVPCGEGSQREVLGRQWAVLSWYRYEGRLAHYLTSTSQDDEQGLRS